MQMGIGTHVSISMSMPPCPCHHVYITASSESASHPTLPSDTTELPRHPKPPLPPPMPPPSTCPPIHPPPSSLRARLLDRSARRLNVALTRARRGLIVVCHPETLLAARPVGGSQHSTSALDGALCLAALLKDAEERNLTLDSTLLGARAL